MNERYYFLNDWLSSFSVVIERKLISDVDDKSFDAVRTARRLGLVEIVEGIQKLGKSTVKSKVLCAILIEGSNGSPKYKLG